MREGGHFYNGLGQVTLSYLDTDDQETNFEVKNFNLGSHNREACLGLRRSK
jgi:hypothetical protein